MPRDALRVLGRGRGRRSDERLPVRPQCAVPEDAAGVRPPAARVARAARGPARTLTAVYARELEDLARDPFIDLADGLNEERAKELLRELGPNRLPAPERPAYLAIAGRQLRDPLVALLVGAAVVSALIGEHVEAGVIAAIVMLNGV